ncbi:MAG: SURF1 family protein [Legionella sp.]|nr:MAG: SURF1 family protein [Legionella sp.]
MPILTCFKHHFTPKWPMIMLTALFLGLFINLGIWQLQRAEEKRLMVAAQATQEKQKATVWTGTEELPSAYKNIRLKGHYLPEIFFLDNQHQQHQWGYNVLSPLKLADGNVVIIDRGWVAGDPSRKVLPKVNFPQGFLNLQGSVYYPSAKQWVLGPEMEKKENKVMVIERIDVKLLSQILQKKVYPFIIRLDKQDPYGFVREWKIVSMSPERHLGYALQWFAMALVILIIFVALNLKKHDEKKDL